MKKAFYTVGIIVLIILSIKFFNLKNLELITSLIIALAMIFGITYLVGLILWRIFKYKDKMENREIKIVVKSEQLACPDCKGIFTQEEIEVKEHCFNCGWEFVN